MVQSARYNYSQILSVGASLILFAGALLMLSGIALCFGSKINWWIAPLAAIAAGCNSYFFGGKKALMAIAGIMAGSLILAGITFDTTFDSLTYHKPCVELLAQGWNPIYDNAPTDNPWILHYARGQELLTATMHSSGLPLEFSKAINIMFFVGVGCTLWVAIAGNFPGLSRQKISVCTIALMCNPMVLAQLLTFYNDQYLYLEIAGMFAAASIISSGCVTQKYTGVLLLFVLGALTIVAVNTKFTHFFFCGICWIIIFGWFIYKHQYRNLREAFIAALISSLLAIFIVGYNPYITNLLNTGDPFYPLLSGEVDIMSNNTPDIFKNCNRFEAFFMAQLSSEQEAWALLSGDFSSDMLCLPSADSRVMGFSIFFSPMLIGSFVLMICAKARPKLWLLWIGAMGCVAIFAQSWWARYIPMPWATGGISLLSYFTRPHTLSRRRIQLCKGIALFVFGCCLASAAIAFSRSFGTRLLAQWR